MARIATIKLYGNIFEWNMNNAQMMALQIEQAADQADEIKLRVHCHGGSVIEGGMIYNAIKNSRIPVDIYVDGIAASMAAVLLPAARKVYMSENAFLMVHAPAGGADGRGTADEHLKAAKALKEMENTFIKALISRTGKTEGEVKKWMQGNNWFSATQALSEKLIDGITDPVAKEAKTLSDTEIQAAKVEDVYGLYTAFLDNSDKIKPKNEMDKEKLIKELGLVGVTANSTDEEVQAAITAKLNAEKTAKETAQNALKEHTKTQITALLDSVKDKLTKEQRTQYEAIGESVGIAALETIIAPLKGVQSFTAAINNVSSNSAASMSQQRNAWNFEEWQKNDPRGLEKMAKTDYEGFNALYKAQFGVEAPK